MVILAMAVLVHVLVLVLIFISGKFGGSHCLLCLLVALFPGSVTMPRMGFFSYFLFYFEARFSFMPCISFSPSFVFTRASPHSCFLFQISPCCINSPIFPFILCQSVCVHSLVCC